MPAGLQVSPMATLQYLYESLEKYREHGSGIFDLEFKSLNIDSLQFTLELITFYTRTWGNFTFSPQVTLGWQREFLNKGNQCKFRSAESDDPFFSADLTSPGRNSATGGVDLLFSFYHKYKVEAYWNFTVNQLYFDNQFYLGFNYLF